MMKSILKTGSKKGEEGAVAVLTAILMAVLIMFAALAVDLGYLYGVRNELQNGADAGALAGAHELLDVENGILTRDDAIAEAERVVSLNSTGNDAVQFKPIETGHWSFTTSTFSPNPTDTQGEWQEKSFAELDADLNFINAVRVVSFRDDTPAFFARIFGFASFLVNTEAIAYIGFAGDLYPGEIDLPIGICKETITDGDSFNCNMGRMLNSGGNAATEMTAMWTNFSQEPCSTASNSDMQDLTSGCSGSNITDIHFGEGMGTQNGVQDNIFGNITDCWEAWIIDDGEGNANTPWPVTLPVIDCGVSNTCSPLVGAVEVNIIWIIHKNDPWSQMKEVPTEMADWTCSTTTTLEDRHNCWKDFVDHFDLENVTGPPVSDEDYEDMYQKKNIFFLPSCEAHEPQGGSGGQNFGILAKIPKLVK
ncbi:TadG family pilus assembly protein [Desulfotalea psychrophila]|uniref:DUF2134 domain-containing protein n=1 Tax=Desulfotalea psychrophila (strain LSv54 / DSM 12343) TaxID=177439 RepID=Q6AN13_DESPS|nr:TadG family pilus assembly protein [Desulfotalea psychrophila]CAG36261.1 unknown protein [Desulfotalea psychrophila LSv54]